MQQNAQKTFYHKNGFLEAAIWTMALLYFAFSTPQIAPHFSWCIFQLLGIHFCPGCGIGRSISFFLHGDFATSWQMHYLGIPATFILAFRVFSLLHKNIKHIHKNTSHE